jgi:YVTN family beta-propeller protein
MNATPSAPPIHAIPDGERYGGRPSIVGVGFVFHGLLGSRRQSGAIAVNPQTGEIAVVNSGSDDVSIVDRDTLHVSTVHAGLLPAAIAVNQVTGYAYIANSWGNSVTAIYGYGEGMLVRSSSSAPAVTGIDTAASVATFEATSRTSRTLNPLD